MQICSDSQQISYVTSADHAAHSAESGRAKRSRDPHRACAAPDATTCPHTRLAPSTGDVFRQLAECSFYFGRLSAAEASRKLSPCAVGTFLLRDSSDRRFLFALSVQTRSGPTSVRLARDDAGRFRLDCDRSQRPVMPAFPSVVDLVRHYFRPATDRQCVLVETAAGATSRVPVALTATLSAAAGPPSLARLCRLGVHHARRRSLGRARTPVADPSDATRTSPDQRDCVDCFADSLPEYVDEKAKTFLRSYPFDL